MRPHQNPCFLKLILIDWLEHPSPVHQSKHHHHLRATTTSSQYQYKLFSNIFKHQNHEQPVKGISSHIKNHLQKQNKPLEKNPEDPRKVKAETPVRKSSKVHKRLKKPRKKKTNKHHTFPFKDLLAIPIYGNEIRDDGPPPPLPPMGWGGGGRSTFLLLCPTSAHPKGSPLDLAKKCHK